MTAHSVAMRVISQLADSPAVRRAARLFFRRLDFLRKWSIQLDGVSFFVPSADRFVALLLERVTPSEPYTLTVFSQLLSPGMTVLDVGANVGRYSVRAAQLVHPDGVVFAIEPEPGNAQALRRTLQGAGLSDSVVVVEKAAGEIDGPLQLYFCEEHRGDHRTYPTSDARRTIPTQGIRLDTLLAGQPLVDVIKIDVQGAEHQVFRGMSALLESSRKVAIVFEYWPRGVQQSGADAAFPLRLLLQHGFTLSLIDESDRCLRPISVEECLARCTNGGYIDLLARRH